MTKTAECIRCRTVMELGFVVDYSEAGILQQKWCSGEPKKGFWPGLKISRQQLIPVTTLRCPQCGYLESYALAKSISG